jgi:ribose-phosphate pyrophosphokinase
MEVTMEKLKIFSGSSHPQLAEKVSQELGISLSPIEIYRYRTGCFEVALNDNVRGCHVFLFQTSLPKEDLLHCHLWELLEMVSAAKKASAEKITVVMPYCSYARSDKKWRGRMPISGKLLAAFLEAAGMDRILGIDFHSSQFEGFFSLETVVDHLRTLPLIANQLKKLGFNSENSLILPGDEGFHKKAEELGKRLGLEVGSVEKIRLTSDQVKIHSIGGLVEGKRIIVADDEVCTAGTIRAITEKLEELKAESVTVAVTHGLFQGKAFYNLSHPLIKEIIVTDTLPIPDEIQERLPLTIISVVPLLAAAIKEIYTGGSVSKLFE